MLLTWEYQEGLHPPPTLATIEHLDSRLSPERGKHDGPRRVVACWLCNNRRGHQEERSLGLSALRLRSGRPQPRVLVWCKEEEVNGRERR